MLSPRSKRASTASFAEPASAGEVEEHEQGLLLARAGADRTAMRKHLTSLGAAYSGVGEVAAPAGVVPAVLGPGESITWRKERDLPRRASHT